MKSKKMLILAIAGTVIFSFGMNVFIVPLGLYSGGFVGVGQLIRTFLVSLLKLNFGNVDIAGIVYYIINIPLFILAYKKLGKSFFWNSIICVTSMMLSMTLIKSPTQPIVTDTLTSALIGGMICGAGTALTLINGGSGGGQDILGMYLTGIKPDFSVGKMGILINILVFGCCALIYDLPIVIYSLIYSVIYSIATDKLHSQNINTQVLIFTHQEEAVVSFIHGMRHSATLWEGKGAYTKKDVSIVFTVVSKYEANLLKKKLEQVEPNAFAIFGDNVSVLGNYEKHLLPK